MQSSRPISSSNHTPVNKKLILLVFSFFLLVNIASSGGHFDFWDGTETFLVTESMVLKHSAKLYPDIPSIKKLGLDIRWSENERASRQGHQIITPIPPLYTVRSLLLSAIAVPFYYAATVFSISPIVVVGLFVNSLIISLTSLVIFCFSFEVYGSRKISFILSLIYAVCSFVWPYNTSLWPQPLQALTLIASAFFIYKSYAIHHQFSFICHYTRETRENDGNNNNKSSRPKSKGHYYAGLGGLFLGLSVFAHPTSVIVIPGLIVYAIFLMRHNRINLSSFLIVLIITLPFTGLVNYLRFGSFTDFGYGYDGTLSRHTGWMGLIGVLISPGEGLIFYLPIAILLPLAFRYMYRQNKGLFFLSAYIIVVNWLYVGTIAGEVFWSGGTAWGPRYLIPVLPFMMIVSGTLFERMKMPHFNHRSFIKPSIIIILCAAGFFINLLGKIVWIFYGLMYGWPYYDNPYHSQFILQLKTLMSGYVTHINPDGYLSMPFWSSLHQGLAPCPVDVYIFCKFGMAPIFLLSAIIVTLVMLIGMEISKFNPNTFVIQLKAIKLSQLLQKY
jgi:hypothetical protein